MKHDAEVMEEGGGGVGKTDEKKRVREVERVRKGGGWAVGLGGEGKLPKRKLQTYKFQSG